MLLLYFKRFRRGCTTPLPDTSLVPIYTSYPKNRKSGPDC